MSDAIGSEYWLAPGASQVHTPTSLVTSGVVDVLGDNMPGLFDFAVDGADVYILFGNLSTLGAATAANAYPLSAGSRQPWYITAATRYMQVIAKQTVSGSQLVHYRSGP